MLDAGADLVPSVFGIDLSRPRAACAPWREKPGHAAGPPVAAAKVNLLTQEISELGTRIHVIGSSCSGKSTLAERLATALDGDFVELDALNWLPGWVALNETDRPARGAALPRCHARAALGQRRLVHRCRAARFLAASANYRLLDLPAALSIGRMVRRSWRRWRTKELLWGTNVERFWPQFMLWRAPEDSLLLYIATQHAANAAKCLPRWPTRAGRIFASCVWYRRPTWKRSRAAVERSVIAPDALRQRDDAALVSQSGFPVPAQQQRTVQVHVASEAS